MVAVLMHIIDVACATSPSIRRYTKHKKLKISVADIICPFFVRSWSQRENRRGHDMVNNIVRSRVVWVTCLRLTTHWH